MGWAFPFLFALVVAGVANLWLMNPGNRWSTEFVQVTQTAAIISQAVEN